MKETTKIFIQALIANYNKACKNKDFEKNFAYENMLSCALTVLKLEGIETLEIVYDDTTNYYSPIHIK